MQFRAACRAPLRPGLWLSSIRTGFWTSTAVRTRTSRRANRGMAYGFQENSPYRIDHSCVGLWATQTSASARRALELDDRAAASADAWCTLARDCYAYSVRTSPG